MDFEIFVCFALGAIACMLCPLTMYILDIRNLLAQIKKNEK